MRPRSTIRPKLVRKFVSFPGECGVATGFFVGCGPGYGWVAIVIWEVVAWLRVLPDKVETGFLIKLHVKSKN